MTDSEMSNQVAKLQTSFMALQKACADTGAELALLVWCLQEESVDDE